MFAAREPPDSQQVSNACNYCVLYYIVKRILLSILSTALVLTPVHVNAQSYLTESERTFLELVNRYLDEQGNPFALTSSSAQKLEWGRDTCSYLKQGLTLQELVDIFNEVVLKDKTLTDFERRQRVQFSGAVKIGAVYTLCPEYKSQAEGISANRKK